MGSRRTTSLPMASHQLPPCPPDLRLVPQGERAAVMSAWLVQQGIEFDDTVDEINSAWTRAKQKHRDAARRERERQAHSASGSAQPLPSSIARAAARAKPTPPVPSERRERNAEYGRELLGLHVSVPWSAWEGYGPSQYECGVVFEYHAQPPGRFVVRFPDESECHDIGMGWAELLGEQPCLASATEVAQLHVLPSQDLTPQPRGAPSRDGVWDQREAAWIGSDGMPLKERVDMCSRCIVTVERYESVYYRTNEVSELRS